MTSPDVRRSRQAALAETGLLDSLPEASFDRYTRLATRLLDVPVSLISLVDGHRQFFKSARGLPEPWASARQTPLSHSFCLQVADTDAPLVVSDAREDVRVRDNLAIVDIGVIAYAGMPLHAPGGTAIGSFCAIDSQPREWSEDDLRVLQDLADAVSSEVALRVAAARQRAFVSSASHELQSPLTALRLRLEDLSIGSDVGEDAAAELRLSLQEVDRLSAAVSRLLPAARLDAFHAVERVDLSAVARAAATAWEPVAEHAGRDLSVKAGDAVLVHAPAAGIRQILDVLLGNALTHGEGDVLLEVTSEADHLRIRVQDEGAGIPSSVSAELFRRGSTGGTGLALAAELTRTLGGRLILLPGAPTTFDLVLARG
jgi:signal transduction histidine kinase